MSSTSLKIRIGTRASNLAMAQSLEVKNLLLAQNQFSEDQIEIVPITTSGDKIQDRNLADIGGKGLFIKELEDISEHTILKEKDTNKELNSKNVKVENSSTNTVAEKKANNRNVKTAAQIQAEADAEIEAKAKQKFLDK